MIDVVPAVIANSGERILSPTPTRTAVKPFATYPGSKDAAGSAERIVRLFPPHSLYVEPFLGGGAVLRRKTPALRTIGIDDDGRVVAAWKRVEWPGLELIEDDGLSWLEASSLPADALVYADPPYPRSTRSRRRLYAHEWTDAEHRRLLDCLLSLPCSVVVSSYENPMYSEAFAAWERDSWRTMTRGGVRIEHAWASRSTLARFGESARCAGRDFRERERLKRKAQRWRAKLERMPERERAVILAELIAAYSDAAGTLARSGDSGSPSPAASPKSARLEAVHTGRETPVCVLSRGPSRSISANCSETASPSRHSNHATNTECRS